MAEFRTEHDSMGEIAVPKEALWGAQTQRSLENFPIGGEKMPEQIIHAFGLLKKAAALANHTLLPERMTEEKIARINALYKKSKTEGLTEAEYEEQHALRQEFLDSVRKNLKSQLDNIDIQEDDGTVVNLGEKYGHKK